MLEFYTKNCQKKKYLPSHEHKIGIFQVIVAKVISVERLRELVERSKLALLNQTHIVSCQQNVKVHIEGSRQNTKISFLKNLDFWDRTFVHETLDIINKHLGFRAQRFYLKNPNFSFCFVYHQHSQFCWKWNSLPLIQWQYWQYSFHTSLKTSACPVIHTSPVWSQVTSRVKTGKDFYSWIDQPTTSRQ